MSTVSTTDTPFARVQQSQLAVLLDVLDGLAISDAERRSLTWLAGSATSLRTSPQ